MAVYLPQYPESVINDIYKTLDLREYSIKTDGGTTNFRADTGVSLGYFSISSDGRDSSLYFPDNITDETLSEILSIEIIDPKDFNPADIKNFRGLELLARNPFHGNIIGSYIENRAVPMPDEDTDILNHV